MGETTNLKNVLLISVFLVATTCSIAAGRTIYVDDSAAAGGNGESWVRAYKYLRNAIAVAYYGDKIAVAQGIYRPDEDSAHPSGTGDREATFQLISGVTIKGGYAGAGTPDPNARDIQLYETVLSGDLNGDDGPDFANNGENSYHVVTGTGTDETAVLDGFTIAGGNAHYFDPDSWVDNRRYGGGMYNRGGSLTLKDCTFSGNSADRWGGGIYNSAGDMTLMNCKFSGNRATHEVICDDGDCWEVHGDGGGMMSSGSPMLINCTFTDNSAERNGGGMANYGNAMLIDCTFSNNSALTGAGMYNSHSESTLSGCRFSGNSAERDGGGMGNRYNSTPIISNCVFSGNSANEEGGGYGITLAALH